MTIVSKYTPYFVGFTEVCMQIWKIKILKRCCYIFKGNTFFPEKFSYSQFYSKHKVSDQLRHKLCTLGNDRKNRIILTSYTTYKSADVIYYLQCVLRCFYLMNAITSYGLYSTANLPPKGLGFIWKKLVES